MLQTQHALASNQAGRDQSDLGQMFGMLRALDAKVEDLRSMMTRRRKEHLTVEEFAEAVGRSAYTIRRWISNGKVNAIRIEGTGPRGRLIIPRAELEHVVESGVGTNVPDTALG